MFESGSVVGAGGIACVYDSIGRNRTYLQVARFMRFMGQTWSVVEAASVCVVLQGIVLPGSTLTFL